MVELLNKKGEWYTLFIFSKSITFLAYSDGSGLKDIFQILAQRLTPSKSVFSFCEVLIGSRTTENIEVSSAKRFTLDFRLPDKLLVYIYIYIKINGPIIGPEAH